jgi:predicted RNA binding protein YcfA (HicA-like mRNA interferase family)
VAKLPRLTGKEMLRFLEQQGFTIIRIRGSHHFLDRGDQRTSVPVHGNRTLKTGTLRSILRDIGMSPSDFERLLTS